MRGRGIGLRRVEKPSAYLSRASAGDQDGGYRIPIADTTGSDERQPHTLRDQTHKRQQSELSYPILVDKAGAMPACLHSLDDHGICPYLSGKLCLVGFSDRHPDLDTGVVQLVDELPFGTAEGEGNYGRPLHQDQIQLRLPPIVGPLGVSGFGANARGFSPNALAIGTQPFGIGGILARDKQIDAERCGSCGTDLMNILAKSLGREVASGQDPEGSGPARRDGQLGRRSASREGRLNDGELQAP
jgi:hypothetical protein